MRDRSFLFAALFSLSIHGVLASFLIPPSRKGCGERAFEVEIAWEKSPFPPQSQEPVVAKPKGKKALPLNKGISHLKKVKYIPAILMESRPREEGFVAKGKSGETRCTPGAKKELQAQTYQPLPKYPHVCRKRRQEGIVSLNVKTNAKGHVIDVSLNKSSGHLSLDEAALEAVKGWVFDRGDTEKTLSIAFRLK